MDGRCRASFVEIAEDGIKIGLSPQRVPDPHTPWRLKKAVISSSLQNRHDQLARDPREPPTFPSQTDDGCRGAWLRSREVTERLLPEPLPARTPLARSMRR